MLLAFGWAVLFWPNVSAADSTGSLSTLESAMNQLVYEVSRSVVTIEASTDVADTPGGHSDDERVINLVSSGIIYDTDGHILAAAASIVGRDHIFVDYHKRLYQAQLVGIDHQTGLALLKIARTVGFPAAFTPDQGCAGQMIIVVGNSYGVQASPSMGFCAGSRSDGELQFSAQMTSGAIGGGVFNLSGQCMGIITGGLGQTSNTEVGLALPAHRIQAIVEYLKAHGDRIAGYVGLTTTDIEISPPIEIPTVEPDPNAQVAAASSSPLTSPETQTTDLIDRAVLIKAVTASSAAARAGLLAGDLIFSCNGRYINSAFELEQTVHRTTPGDLITLGIMRGSTPYLVDVVVDSLFLSPAVPPLPGASSSKPTDMSYEQLLREIQQLKSKVERLESTTAGHRR